MGARLLIGCGVLQRELERVVHERGWAVDLQLLGPALHTDLGKLERAFAGQLARTAGRDRAVFFGACHPRLDATLATHHLRRTPGVNCIELLLGRERYEAELASGTYFLLESWARTWRLALHDTFGPRPELVREVFRGAHTRMLAVRTPCSGDFTAQAQRASDESGLPLAWLDVDLTHLAAALEPLVGAPSLGRCA
jgi:hypothetical protein